MKRTILARSLATLSISIPSIYAIPALSADNIDTLTITATGFEQQISDVIAPVEVITKDEIDAIQAQSLSELLRRLPGVQVANSGGAGQQSDLYVRGRSTKNTLVLINGVRIGSATTGTPNLAAIPLQGIQRIEFLRGPRAAVYGSDAVSGVINLITTGATERDNNVKLGYGSDNLVDISGSFNLFNTEKSWLNVSGTYTDTDGYNVQPESTNPYDADEDGYSTKYLLLDFGYQANENLTFKSNGYYQAHKTEFDNPWGGVDKTDSVLYNLAAIGEFTSARYDSTLTLAANQDQSESYGQEVDKSEITTVRTAINWNNLYYINRQLSFTGGVDWYLDDVINTSVTMTETQRTNAALFLGSYYQSDLANIEANVRVDDNSAFGEFFTYQIGAGLNTSDNTRLIAQHGTSFKAPTFNELYWPLECGFWGCYSGNPDLKPEETSTSEVAFEADFNLASFRVAGHYSDITNLIASSNSTQENINKGQIKGVEVVSLFTTGPLFHSVSYDYTDGKDLETDLAIAKVAKHNAKWNVSYEISNWAFDLAYLYQGERFNDTANTIVLDPYSLVDVAGSYLFSNGLRASAKVANLLNEEYEAVQGYKTPVRNYYVSVDYSF